MRILFCNSKVFALFMFWICSALGQTPDCIKTFSNSSGSFQTPEYPDPYPNTIIYCLWTIQAPDSYQVNLHVPNYDIDSSAVIRVYDEDSSSATVITTLDGINDTTTYIISSSKNILAVEFIGLSNTQGSKGFNISWESNIACGYETSDSSGVLQSPFFGQNYSISDHCVWIIHAPEGKQITLNVEDFELDSSTDFLEIRDGEYETSPLIGSFNGAEIPKMMSSTGNHILLNLTRSVPSPRKGFNMTWTNTECGGDFTTPTGKIISPNYPFPYPKFENCVWRIQPYGPIKLNVLDFELYDSHECEDDYLEVRDGIYGSSPLIGKFCGNSIPVNLLTAASGMYLRFVSSQQTGYPGFSMTWSPLDESQIHAL